MLSLECSKWAYVKVTSLETNSAVNQLMLTEWLNSEFVQQNYACMGINFAIVLLRTSFSIRRHLQCTNYDILIPEV